MSARIAFAGALLALACGGSLRTVPTGVPRGAAPTPIVVDQPPPPARVERVPPDPGRPCAFLDGRWEYRAHDWEWTPGGWVHAPDGCSYAFPEAVWVPASGRGLLFYLPGRWYRDDGGAAPCTPRPCP